MPNRTNKGWFRKGHPQLNTGKTHWKKGDKWSKEVREKMSKSRKGRKITWADKISKANIGKKGLRGKDNPMWKGGKYIEHGYYFILSPNHPFKNNKGYVKRSRLVMEKKLGRYLKPQEIVHHINENTLDDCPENLQLFPSLSAHHKLHRQQERSKAYQCE